MTAATTSRRARTVEQLHAELREAIDSGRLRPDPTAEAIRAELQVAPRRARALRDELRHQAGKSAPDPAESDPIHPTDPSDALDPAESAGPIRRSGAGRQWIGDGGRWAAGGTIIAALFVAVTSFVLAYDGSRGAALDAGYPAGTAGWYPACVEGVLVVAGICTVVLGGWLPWSVMLAFSGLSVGANVEHALRHGAGGWFPLLVAAVPPAALPLCVELVIRAVRKLVQPAVTR